MANKPRALTSTRRPCARRSWASRAAASTRERNPGDRSGSDSTAFRNSASRNMGSSDMAYLFGQRLQVGTQFLQRVTITAGGGIWRLTQDIGDFGKSHPFPDLQHHDFRLAGGQFFQGPLDELPGLEVEGRIFAPRLCRLRQPFVVPSFLCNLQCFVANDSEQIGPRMIGL